MMLPIRLHSTLPPLHVRIFVACRVLQYLDMEDEARRRFKEWSDKIGVGQAFTIKGTDGRVGALPVSHLLGAVSAVVDYLIKKPLGPLGGFALPAIPSLSLSISQLDKMREVSRRFLEGEPADVSGRMILGAAQLAVEKSNALTQAVAKAALRSLGGEGDSIEAGLAQTVEAKSFQAHVRSPRLVMRAVVTAAAIAPRTARLAQRRQRLFYYLNLARKGSLGNRPDESINPVGRG
jgi:hypothetical protein